MKSISAHRPLKKTHQPDHENKQMGRVVVDVEVVNSYDEESCKKRLLKPEQVRRIKVSALVDTGATLLSIPEEEIKKLGVQLYREAVSKFANGQKSVRKIYGPV